MVCNPPMPIYANDPFRGCRFAGSKGDGYSIDLRWYKAQPWPITYTMAYNIYYSTDREEVFNEGVKYVIIDSTRDTITITGLKPGDVYYFAVRATEFERGTVRLNQLPEVDNCKVYPEAALRYTISDSTLLIPVEDADQFPPLGVVLIGAELIQYTSLDIPDGYLVLSDISQRGVYDTSARMHMPDGYDGYQYYDNPLVRHFWGFEDDNIAVEMAENKFQYPHYPATAADGYKERVDIVNKNLDPIEAANQDFNPYDFAGWRRNHPADLLSGRCVGSYFGGEYYCADGYDGIGRQIRGVNIQDLITQREEVLLEITGVPCVLLRKITEGKYSKHYENKKLNTAYRGLDNFGTTMVHGYEQYFNDRRADGRIFIRFGPTKEDIKRNEDGLENEFIPDCWTLVTPPIKDGDVIIRYAIDGTEEFRYEITNVTRNDTFLEETGAQKFTAHRVRKTDPIYQVPVNADTSTIPTTITTSIGMVAGLIPPHVHNIQISGDNVTSVSQINQMTGISQGHNHRITNGTIAAVDNAGNELGHTHTIILL